MEARTFYGTPGPPAKSRSAAARMLLESRTMQQHQLMDKRAGYQSGDILEERRQVEVDQSGYAGSTSWEYTFDDEGLDDSPPHRRSSSQGRASPFN